MKAARWQDLLSDRFDAPGQAWLTAHLSQPMGRGVAALAWCLGMTPNAVTLSGLGLSLLGCLAFMQPHLGGVILAAALWQLAFGFDCADGQLARASGRSSRFGAWLDIACDHVRQTALSLAVLWVLLRDFDVAAYLAVLMFLAAQTNFLHVVAAIGQSRPPAHDLRGGGMEIWRRGMVNMLDTPVLLLVLPLLAGWPEALLVFVVIYGGLLSLRTGLLAMLRIRRQD